MYSMNYKELLEKYNISLSENNRLIESKQAQWTAFRNRLKQEGIPKSFKEIVAALDRFLSPVVAAITTEKSIPTKCTATGQCA